jgi:hypothetical protein
MAQLSSERDRRLQMSLGRDEANRREAERPHLAYDGVRWNIARSCPAQQRIATFDQQQAGRDHLATP